MEGDEKTGGKMSTSPLCVFCLSPPFTIPTFTRSPSEKSTSRRLSVGVRRRGDSSQSSVRSRFKPYNKRASNFLSKHIQETLNNCNGQTLRNFEQVLSEIQKAWRDTSSPSNSLSFGEMDNHQTDGSKRTEIMVSPILLRRRLSAPETIMRKHALAQRSDSQDSDSSSHSGDSKHSHFSVMHIGSDTSLNKKRDSDSMRRSILLRRFFSKPLSSSRFSGSFNEWQRSYGRSSINSSPEHHVKSNSRRSLNDDFKYSPQHQNKSININSNKLSPKHSSISKASKTKIAMYNGNFESYSNTTSFSENLSTSMTNRETMTDVETSRCTNTSYTVFSDNNSDSAYTLSRSNNSLYSNNNNNNNNDESSVSEIHKDIVSGADASNQEISSIKLSKSVVSNYSKSSEANESSTQTPKTTNVNVISNVQLSQSTLDLIFNQVMQDVNQNPSNDDVKITQLNSQSQIVHVQSIPSFYLKCREQDIDDNLKKMKSMISNIGIGSPYSKSSDQQAQNIVPRYSAAPLTTSMEVNISSGDSDKESDTVSLVDSLEDQLSPRGKVDDREKTGVKSDVSLELPDNSDKTKQQTAPISKPTAFFIPIQVDDQHLDSKASVSELLPNKVKNRLLKRQKKREEKSSKSKQSSIKSENYLSSSDKGVFDISDTPLSDYCLPKSAKTNNNKLHLPNIESLRKIKIDKNKVENKIEHKIINKSFKRKTFYKDNLTESFSSKTKTHWTPKAKNKSEKLSPICTTKNEYVYDCGPRRIYHKTEFNNNSNKQIEILEIMECVEAPATKSKCSGKKSKIPVLVNQKLPKVNSKSEKSDKPTYLDLNNDLCDDPRLDQLIANILIETLNIPEVQSSLNQSNNSNPTEAGGENSQCQQHQQKFDPIPEEFSTQSSKSTEDCSNNNFDSNIKTKKQSNSFSDCSAEHKDENNENYQGKAAVAVVKDENFSSIPKGWITFYMLRKNQGSPESTSDEGNEMDDKCRVKKSSEKQCDETENHENSINSKLKSKGNDLIMPYLNVQRQNDSNRSLSDRTISPSSSSEYTRRKVNVCKPLNHILMGRLKKQNMRKIKQKVSNNDNEKKQLSGEWTVTVSGRTNCGHAAPNLEMCLKFPDKNCLCPSQSDSGLGEDNERTHFPQIHSKQRSSSYSTKNAVNKSDNNSLQQRLPQIDSSQIYKGQRRSESSVPSVGSFLSSRLTEPRQTKTSTKRYHLSRPKIDYPNNGNSSSRNNNNSSSNLDVSNSAISLFNERHYAELLRRFPELLSINGNRINQKNK